MAKLIQEDLIKELAIFGLTLNQAKVYLTILQAGSISVGEIAEVSKLYRQDIYKILPKLEKKGLIIKTLGAPILAKAIPVKRALKTLVEIEKKNASERIIHMESNLKEISNAMSILYETEKPAENDKPSLSLLTEENEITNKTDLLFEEAETRCDVVASLKLLTLRATEFRERFQIATKNGAKIRLIVDSPTKAAKIKATVERVMPDSNNFAAKLRRSKYSKPFQVIDRKEVWISTSIKQPSGLPCVLWSNDKNIVATYQETFERLWKSEPKNHSSSKRKL